MGYNGFLLVVFGMNECKREIVMNDLIGFSEIYIDFWIVYKVFDFGNLDNGDFIEMILREFKNWVKFRELGLEMGKS